MANTSVTSTNEGLNTMGEVGSILESLRAVSGGGSPWIWLIAGFVVLVIARAIHIRKRTDEEHQQSLNEALNEFHSTAANVSLQCQRTRITRDEKTTRITRYRDQLAALEKKFKHSIRYDLNKCGPFPRPPGYSEDFPHDLENVITQLETEVQDCVRSASQIGTRSRTGGEIYEINNLARKLDHCGPLLESYRAGIDHKVQFIEHLCSPKTLAALDHIYTQVEQIEQKNTASQGAISRAFYDSYVRVLSGRNECLDQYRHEQAIESTSQRVQQLLREIENLESAPLRLAACEKQLNRLNELCTNIQTHYAAFQKKYPGEKANQACIKPHCDYPQSPSYYLTHLARAKAKVDEFNRSLESAKYYMTPTHANIEQATYALDRANAAVFSVSQIEQEVSHIEAQRAAVIDRANALCSKLQAKLLPSNNAIESSNQHKRLADLLRKLAANKSYCAETLFEQAEEIERSSSPAQDGHFNGLPAHSTSASIGAGVDNGPTATYAPLPTQDSSSSAQYDYSSSDSGYDSGNSDSSSGPSGGGESGGGGATSDL